MRPKLRQRGEGRVGCLFWAVVFAVVALIGVKAVPVKYKSSQLFDFMDEQAKFAQQTTPDAMKKAILRKARELQLPLDPKKLTVSKQGGRITSRLPTRCPSSSLGTPMSGTSRN